LNVKLVIFTLGNLLIFLAAAMLFPLLIAVYYRSTNGEDDLPAFIYALLVTLAVGLTLRLTTKSRQELRIKEGFAVVALGWAGSALFGALPFVFHRTFAAEGRNGFQEFAFCYFESMSGFSTTGATVLTAIEHLPHGLLFWRSLTHWLGGMGIVVLALAILPMLGVGGMQLFRAEVPGPQKDRLTPRITQTAKLLWGVYALISLVEMLLLWAGGMTLFDSACHTFGTMATGGFSTKNRSIGQYDSVYFDVVITVFMFIAGTNFALHYRALRGDLKAYVKDTEFRFYGLVVVLCTALIVLNTMTAKVGGAVVYASIGDAVRYASFQVSSIATTTGYGTYDFEKWPPLSQFLLVILMFFGGCAGSTGGGLKQVRFLLLIKQGYIEVKRMILPNAIFPVKLGERVVPPEVMLNILNLFFIFIGIFAVVTCLMAAMGMDIVSAASATIASMGNIGPGLGSVGPADNYAHVPTLGKFVLSFCMLMGRLELYTVLVLFAPELWKR